MAGSIDPISTCSQASNNPCGKCVSVSTSAASIALANSVCAASQATKASSSAAISINKSASVWCTVARTGAEKPRRHESTGFEGTSSKVNVCSRSVSSSTRVVPSPTDRG